MISTELVGNVVRLTDFVDEHELSEILEQIKQILPHIAWPCVLTKHIIIWAEVKEISSGDPSFLLLLKSTNRNLSGLTRLSFQGFPSLMISLMISQELSHDGDYTVNSVVTEEGHLQFGPLHPSNHWTITLPS